MNCHLSQSGVTLSRRTVTFHSLIRHYLHDTVTFHSLTRHYLHDTVTFHSLTHYLDELSPLTVLPDAVHSVLRLEASAFAGKWRRGNYEYMQVILV
jgi:hypothetical protein